MSMPTVVSSTLSAVQATSLISAPGLDVQVIEFKVMHRAREPSEHFQEKWHAVFRPKA